MIPCVDNPEVISSGTPLIRIDMMQMDPEDMKVMLENSRDGFYSNKELAPIREYSTNARDAHIRKGIGETPIQVTLPTEMEPVFKVRDFGSGLTLEQITDVYFRYWKSTKRNSNDENGCLGIGAKSAFAYTAIYNVTTWCEGMKTVVTGQKNGFADVIYRGENTQNEAEGVEVSIPVLQKDIEKFTLEAMNLFKYWDVRPTFINVSDETMKEHFTLMDTKQFLTGEGWEIRPAGYGRGESVAVMSNVAYRIDWSQIRNGIDKGVLSKVQGIFEFLEQNITTFRFKNGTLSFTPNRESLQYNEPTLLAMTEMIVAVYEALLKIITDKISEADNIWAAKIIFNSIFRKDLEGFDKSVLYGGNLSAIEQLVKHRVLWRGINITSGLFNNLQLWDKELGQQPTFDKDITQIFQTFVKSEKGSGVKACRCNAKRNNKIYASPKSLVIIQDTTKARLSKAAAEYYLLQSGMDISQVYVLNLSVPSVHDAFMKAYSFASVPAIRISQVESLIVAYIKTNRVSGGGTAGISTPIYCPSIDVKDLRDKKDGSINDIYWNQESETPKGLSGGIYVQYQKRYGSGGGMYINGNFVDKYHANHYIQGLWDLCNELGIAVEKVYGIHQRTIDSVWFNKAKDAGQWVELTGFIKENVAKLDQDSLKKLSAYYKIEDAGRIGVITANQLLPLLTETESPAYVYCKMLVDEIKEKNKFFNICNYYNILISHVDESTVIRDMIKKVAKTYPMVFCHRYNSAIACNNTNSWTLDKTDLQNVADYINMVDKSA